MALQDNAKKFNIRPQTGSADDNPRAPRYDAERGGWYPPERTEPVSK